MFTIKCSLNKIIGTKSVLIFYFLIPKLKERASQLNLFEINRSSFYFRRVLNIAFMSEIDFVVRMRYCQMSNGAVCFCFFFFPSMR